MLYRNLLTFALLGAAAFTVAFPAQAEMTPHLQDLGFPSTSSADLLVQGSSPAEEIVLPEDDLGNQVIIEAAPRVRPEPKLYINLDTFVLGDTNFTRSNLAVPQAFAVGSGGISAFPRLDESTRLILSASYGFNRSFVSTREIASSTFGTNSLVLAAGFAHDFGNNLNVAVTYTHLRFFAEVANQDILTDNIVQMFLTKTVPLDRVFSFGVLLNPSVHTASSDAFSRFELSLRPSLTAQWTPGVNTTLGYTISYGRYFNQFINTRDPNFLSLATTLGAPLPQLGRDDFRNLVSLENSLTITPELKLKLDLYYVFNSSTLPVSNYNSAFVIFGFSAAIPVY